MKRTIFAILAAVLLLPACSKSLETIENNFSATGELVAGQTAEISIAPAEIKSFLLNQADARISLGVNEGAGYVYGNRSSWWFNSRGIAVEAGAMDAVFSLTPTSDIWTFTVKGDDALIYESVGSTVTADLAYKVVSGGFEYVARVVVAIKVLKGSDCFAATATVRVGGATVAATANLDPLAKALKLSGANELLGSIASGVVTVYPVDSDGIVRTNNASEQKGTDFDYGAWFDRDGNVVEEAEAAYRCNITMGGLLVSPGKALAEEGVCSFKYAFAKAANVEFIEFTVTAKGQWAQYEGKIAGAGLEYEIKMTPSSNLPLVMSVPDEVYALLALTNYKGRLGSLLETGLIHVYAFNGEVDIRNLYTGRHTAGSKLDPTKEYGGTYFGQTHGYWFNAQGKVCEDTDAGRTMSFVITNEGVEKAFIEVQQAPDACKAGQSYVFAEVLYNDDFIEMLGSAYIPIVYRVSIVSDL